ncbi:MAG: hypothetical protein LBV27_02635, partial [Oscillospiraceae bacterium]|nr:hypothetical protein [Oscillospiraceae bacterium]
MSATEELSALLERQEALQAELRREARRLESLDFVSRNQSLEARLEKLSAETEALRTRCDALGAENR